MTSIRYATPDDAGVVGRLLFEFNTEFEAPTPPAEQFAARFHGLLARSDVLVLLAQDQKAPTAFAYLTLRPTPYDEGPMAQLEELYVVPDRRNHGIGTALIHRLVDDLRARGVSELHINVDEVDVDTRRFYERHGFVNVEPGTDWRMLCSIREFTEGQTPE